MTEEHERRLPLSGSGEPYRSPDDGVGEQLAGEAYFSLERLPWRGALWSLAGAALIFSFAGSFFLSTPAQVSIARFLIPPYSYACIGLAVMAATDSRGGLAQKLLLGACLLALSALSVLTYAADGLSPLPILGLHLACMAGWVAARRRPLLTALWMGQTLAWIALAAAQGRLTWQPLQ